MPKTNEEEITVRKTTIEQASKYAAEVPYRVMQTANKAKTLLSAMVEIGNPASVTDAGVGALCCLTAIEGAYMNVLINTKDLGDKTFAANLNTKAEELMQHARQEMQSILAVVHKEIAI
jgi:Methenyl tetrahydrofolate cyclohydrolase